MSEDIRSFSRQDHIDMELHQNVFPNDLFTPLGHSHTTYPWECSLKQSIELCKPRTHALPLLAKPGNTSMVLNIVRFKQCIFTAVLGQNS